MLEYLKNITDQVEEKYGDKITKAHNKKPKQMSLF